MDSRYEIEPERIGGSMNRRLLLAVIAALVVVGVVLVKPWDAPEERSEAIVPTPRPVGASTSPDQPALDPRPRPGAPVLVAVWPAAAVASDLASQTAKQVEGALASLAARAGTWGVGNAGVGPRMLRDEPWSDWTAVPVEIADGGPLHIAIWPGTDLCAGYPTIYDLPTLVAVTTPRDVAPDRILRGWWTDGARVASLTDSVFQVSPPGNRGIGYLERVDQAPWPPGLYEFHVVAGERSVSLTVCLTRRG